MNSVNTWWSQASGLGILVSGGAPSVYLAAGALCAFYQHQVSFDVIAASGAGTLPGLLYAVPKGGNQVQALENTVNFNIYDAIYASFRTNYKVFHKSGAFSQLLWQWGQMLPRFPLTLQTAYHESLQRLYNDWIDLLVTAVTPTELNYFSKSVLTRIGVVEEHIDWPALPHYPKEYYVNAFNINTYNLDLFNKHTLTPQSFYAALAMPWLYRPVTANGQTYTEGASHDPSGLEALLCYGRIPDIHTIIVLDTLSVDIWTDPENIYDALQITIMDPIIALSEYILSLYGVLEARANTQAERTGDPSQALPKLYRVPFPIPQWEVPKIFTWSSSNAFTLWHIGYDAVDTFCRALHAGDLTALESYRYHHYCQPKPRMHDFLTLFDELLEDS